MPFGILKLAVFDRARQILDGYKNDNEVRKEFDRLIPKNFVPNTEDGKRGMLNRLQEITNTLQNGIQNGLRNGGQNALDFFYETYFDFNLTSIQHSGEEFNDIKKRIMDNQNSYNYEIECIFKVEKRNKNEIKNEVANNETKQLLHAVYPNNILGILKEGLRKRSNLPHVVGVRFASIGDGIYFSETMTAALRRFTNNFSEIAIFSRRRYSIRAQRICCERRRSDHVN